MLKYVLDCSTSRMTIEHTRKALTRLRKILRVIVNFNPLNTEHFRYLEQNKSIIYSTKAFIGTIASHRQNSVHDEMKLASRKYIN